MTNPYDIVIIPEPKIASEAIKTSGKLTSLGTFFTLDNKTHFPHISLYMLQLKDEDLENAFDLLKGIANNTSIIQTTSKLFGFHNNYIDVEYVKSEEMLKLQMDVINALNPIRDGLRENDKERLPTSEGEEKEAILKYGYRSVGELFAPHLTFTRFKEPQEDVSHLLPDMKMFEGAFPELAIYEMGDNGTCIRELRSWKLN